MLGWYLLGFVCSAFALHRYILEMNDTVSFGTWTSPKRFPGMLLIMGFELTLIVIYFIIKAAKGIIEIIFAS